MDKVQIFGAFVFGAIVAGLASYVLCQASLSRRDMQLSSEAHHPLCRMLQEIHATAQRGDLDLFARKISDLNDNWTQYQREGDTPPELWPDQVDADTKAS